MAELGLLGLVLNDIVSTGEDSDYAWTEQALAIARISLLLGMCSLFLIASRTISTKVSFGDNEASPLLGHGNHNGVVNGNGTMSKANAVVREKAVDAQSMGWLDYFVGFSVLFPYIW